MQAIPFLLCLAAMPGLLLLDRVLGWGRLPWPWTLLGLGPVVGGISWNLLLTAHLRRAGTSTVPGRGAEVLVTDGPWRFSRNPMYLGQVVILLGAAILHGSWLCFAPVPVLVVLLDRVSIRAEEEALAADFGEEYEAYRARVRRWL